MNMKANESTLKIPSGMVHIPASDYVMGGDDEYAGESESPCHKVWIDDLVFKDAPVTNIEFSQFADATGYVTSAEQVGDCCDDRFPTWRTYNSLDRKDHPVVCVSWVDADEYCAWLGAGYRLPTEAEWEKAARGRLEGSLYPWGAEDPKGRACWNKFDETIGTTPIKSFAENQYGVYDLAGNVWEWCLDWYQEDYYQVCSDTGEPSRNPTGPEFGKHKVRRGAAWNIAQPFRMRCSNRGAMWPNLSYSNIGFRYVCPLF